MLLLLSGMLLLSACGAEKPTAAPADNGEKGGIVLPAEPEIAEPEPPVAVAPFTGLALIEAEAEAENSAEALDKLAKQRPIAVMINNYKAARPQSGLSHADIVWEVLAEGGITRLVAIFQSDNTTETIGPIRSIRPYLIEMGEMYNAVLVHAGASNDGYAILQQQHKQHLDEISNAGPFFWRESFRKAPHNLYSNLEKMRAGAEQKKYPQDVEIPVMKFIALPESQEVSAATNGSDVPQSGEAPDVSGEGTGSGGATSRSVAGGTAAVDNSSAVNSKPASDSAPVLNGAAAREIEIYFSLKNYRVSYTYDDEKQLYNRFVDKEPHIDLNNEEQLSASNLVVLGMKHRTLDDVGRLSVDLSSGGPAMLFQQGNMVECEWVRASGDVIRLMKDGQELPFVPGKTYYHIVPMTPTFDDHVTIG